MTGLLLRLPSCHRPLQLLLLGDRVSKVVHGRSGLLLHGDDVAEVIHRLKALLLLLLLLLLLGDAARLHHGRAVVLLARHRRQLHHADLCQQLQGVVVCIEVMAFNY